LRQVGASTYEQTGSVFVPFIPLDLGSNEYAVSVKRFHLPEETADSIRHFASMIPNLKLYVSDDLRWR
jgi:hypothetical protein